MTLFTEVFPVVPAALPKLYAWKLDLPAGVFSTVGGKLAYRLRGPMGGHWVWAAGRVLTDTEVAPEKMSGFLETLWKDHTETFRGLRRIVPDTGWTTTAQAQADFASRGLLSDADREIRNLLAPKSQNLGEASVERVYETRGWVVRGAPAVSVSVFSRLVYKLNVKEYAKRLNNPDELRGLFVADKTSSLKGEITEIAGQLVDSRKWLLTITQREEMQSLIENAPDDELVVGVLGPRRDNAVAPTTYNYIVSALRIVLRSKDLARFRINRQAAQRALRIEPGRRADLIKGIADVVKKRKLVGAAFNSSMDGFFMNGDSTAFDSRVKFGGGHVSEYSEKTALQKLQTHGIYRRTARFDDGKPIRIGVVNGVRGGNTAKFLESLGRELKRIGFETETVGEEKPVSTRRADLERAVSQLETKADILIGIFVDEIGEDEEDWGSYHDFKSLTVCRGTPSQVIYPSTLQNEFAMGNIVLGVIGKTGNIPYVRAAPLPYCDLVVGVDIARKKKGRLSGSMNATAITRIYFSDGEFLRYVIHDAPIEGETIPPNVIQRLFPMDHFKGKRAVVHRDGYYRGDEKATLKRWGEQIGAEFLLLEILKTGTPRIYATEGDTVIRPPKASAFRLSEHEAFLVSSLPPFKDATPLPLRIRTEAPFGIGDGLNSVLSLTVLHYGSLRPPRLPVTTHYSDRIAYLALQGIKPKNLEGDIPYWL
jgi:hypothetical protein